MFGKWVSGVEFMTTTGALYSANKRVTNPNISLIYISNNICTHITNPNFYHYFKSRDPSVI